MLDAANFSATLDTQMVEAKRPDRGGDFPISDLFFLVFPFVITLSCHSLIGLDS
jgi:hypothetical protein